MAILFSRHNKIRIPISNHSKNNNSRNRFLMNFAGNKTITKVIIRRIVKMIATLFLPILVLIDPQWGEWEEWTSCKNLCSIKERTRTRSCLPG